MTFALIAINDELDSAEAQLYLQSDEAREKDSRIRRVVESGLVGLRDLKNEQIAKLVFAAILISGSTLEMFKGAINTIPDRD